MDSTILVEVMNRGKRTARNCHAHFDVLFQEGTNLPSWKELDWIYSDGHRDSVGSLSYNRRARIELLRFTTTETKLPSEQVNYKYEVDGKVVIDFVTQNNAEIAPSIDFRVSIYGDDVEKHSNVRVFFTSEPRVLSLVEQ
jgi:hypothetical protein